MSASNPSMEPNPLNMVVPDSPLEIDPAQMEGDGTEDDKMESLGSLLEVQGASEVAENPAAGMAEPAAEERDKQENSPGPELAAQGQASKVTTDPAPAAGSAEGKSQADLEKMKRERSRNLNFIGQERLMAVLGASVRHAVKKQFGAGSRDLETVVDTTLRGFWHLLRNNGRAVRGLPVSDFLREVEVSRNRILQQREKARSELKRLHNELSGRQQEMRAEQERFIAETNARGRADDNQLLTQLRAAFQTAGTEADPELLDEVSNLVLTGMHQERSKSVKKKRAEHASEIDNYERRIQKLTQSLETTEQELVRLAKMKNVEEGIASIYRTVQGITGDDAQGEAKREMMQDLFEANLALRDQISG